MVFALAIIQVAILVGAILAIQELNVEQVNYITLIFISKIVSLGYFAIALLSI